MSSADDHALYANEDLDEDEDDDSEEDDLTLPTSNPPTYDDDDDTYSSNLAAGEVTIAVAGTPTQGSSSGVILALPHPKRQRVEDLGIAVVEEKKPPPALDDSRRLFQRLWTDEDEIELLQGFLEYTTQRGGTNSSHHHDTAVFYDQIKSKLQLDFNKNQLMEKLRRLKKKFRTVTSKIDSGKEVVFKSPHDQAAFEISRQIWSGGDAVRGGGGDEGGFEDDEPNPNPNYTPNSCGQNNSAVDTKRKRSRGVKVEEKHQFSQQSHQTATPTATSIPNLIEEAVRSCLSPLLKELLHNAVNGSSLTRGFGGLAVFNPMPLSFGGSKFPGGDMMDERWRKQHVLELEVYSKRLELVQDQIKAALAELRPTGR